MSHADTNSQPAPKPNDKPSVWDLVLADMAERDRMGHAKYGTRLQPFNGRDTLTDAYQGALDLCVYLRGAIYERDNPPLIGGAMIRCHDCMAEYCACLAR